jgi:hypothetical protein
MATIFWASAIALRSASARKFKTVLQERDATLQEQTAKQGDTEQGLKTERDRALAVVAELKAAIEGLSRARPDDGARKQTKRWLNPIAVGIVLLAAVLGGTLASLFSSRPIDAPVEANAAQAATALAESEQLRQAAEAKADQIAADADKIRQTIEVKAAETEKAGQAAEAHAADAEKARQTALARADNADRARLAAEAKEGPPNR